MMEINKTVFEASLILYHQHLMQEASVLFTRKLQLTTLASRELPVHTDDFLYIYAHRVIQLFY